MEMTDDRKWPEGPYLVVDLDGTLSDHRARHHLALAKQWDAFNEACDQDGVNDDVWRILSHLNSVCQVLIVTGRPEKYRERTLRWLLDNFLEVDGLIMKPDDDYSPTAAWKLKALEEIFETKEAVLANVVLVLEDRDSMVEAFRNYGLPCWQVRSGGY